ncbi:MAG: metallophosphoesterase [Deltaproteobacteria bacterium]|nr:metallophosphoesterase [Deltaproteobacteria bacterium]
MSWGRFVVFFAITAAVTALLHRYVWARLVRDAALPAQWHRVATITIVVLAVFMWSALPLSRILPRPAMSALSLIAFGWLGLLFLLVVLFAAGDVMRLGLALIERVRADAPDPSRRVLLGRAIAAAVGVVATGTAAWGVRTALAQLDVRRHRVPLARLPAGLDGMTIAQLTDVHVGPTIGREFIEQVVARTNALAPDVVVITGDLVDGSVDELREHVAPLAGLKAPLGVYFVTGNHEYYSGVSKWLAELRRLGIRVLRNERVELRRGDAVIDLAGVDDWTAHQFGGGHGRDLPRALAGRDPSRELVLLAHQPKAIVEAAKLGVGLQLSGHTHGGQIFPFNYLVKLQQPYVAGLHKHDDAWIYVSRGTGYWGPPMRVGIPAEIAHLTLVRT